MTRQHPLPAAALIVAAGAAGGYVAAGLADGKLREVLLTATSTLIFVALLGGVVKLLLDDVQRTREYRQEQARFVTAVLADLKSVYDRVERVRIVIDAHRSALTYGNEMRDLIDADVQLRNVARALNAGTSGINGDVVQRVRGSVDTMSHYLGALIHEFKTSYKPIADKQRIYEAAFTARLDHAEQSDDPGLEFAELEVPENDAWVDLDALPRLREFRTASPDDDFATGDGRPGGYQYQRDFVRQLDDISRMLRHELRSLAGAPPTKVSQPDPDHAPRT